MSDLSTPFTRDDVDIRQTETVYQGFFRMLRLRLRHRRFDGSWTGEMTRELFDRTACVGVLLYDPAADTVVLVEQFRIGTILRDGRHWLMEVVAGIIDDGETPEDVARREAEEEAGCTITDLVPIAGFYPTPGGCSEYLHLYCGRVDSRDIGGLHGLAEEHEDIRVHVLPADQAIAMADDGRIDNGAALVALFWLDRRKGELRRRWA